MNIVTKSGDGSLPEPSGTETRPPQNEPIDAAFTAFAGMLAGLLPRGRGSVPRVMDPASPRVAAAANKRARRRARNLGVETYRTKSGKVLTQADVEALAAEAERGYDVSRLHPRWLTQADVDIPPRPTPFDEVDFDG